MAAATPETPDLATVHIRILESLTGALSKAISSEYASLAQKKGSIEPSSSLKPGPEVAPQLQNVAPQVKVKPQEVEWEESETEETEPREVESKFHSMFKDVQIAQPLHEESEVEEEFIPREGLKSTGSFQFDSSRDPIQTEARLVVEIPSNPQNKDRTTKSKRAKSTSSDLHQSPRNETGVAAPQHEDFATKSTVFRRSATGQIFERNARGQFVSSEDKYEKSYETSSDSDSEDEFVPTEAKKRRVSPASKPNAKKASRTNTKMSEVSPSSKPSRASRNTHNESLSSEKTGDEKRRPGSNSQKLWENFKSPTSVSDPSLDTEKKGRENILRSDADKREEYEANRSRGVEKSRDYYPATDEEIAAAKIYGRNLVQSVWREEAPKKEKIWGRVWARYGDDEKDDPPAPGPYEWKEKKHLRQFLRRRFATIPVEVAKKPGITLAELLDTNPKEECDPPIPKRTITSSIHFKDVNGESLIVKINTGIEELFDGKACGDMVTHIREAMDRLHHRGVPAPPPSNTDKRHPRKNYREARQYWHNKGKDAGVFHFACWNAKGHAHDKWLRSTGPYSHFLSKDMVGYGSWQFGARVRFLQDMAPVQQAMSLWFETVAPAKYEAYRQHVDTMAEADTGLSAFKFTSNMSFLGLAYLKNIQAHNHKDKGGVRDGWVGMTCVGEFKGGELCFPDLDVKLRFLPGDIILFRSCILQHFVRATIGERSSLVFFSHSSAETRVQNAQFMEEGSEELEKARQEQEDALAKKRAHLEKYKAYSHLPQYPTKKEDLTQKQMDRARRRKIRFLAFARKEEKRGEVASEEVAKIENMPDWSFYELNLIELARWEKGLYPFAPTGSKRKRSESQREVNSPVALRDETPVRAVSEDRASGSPEYVPAEDGSESEDVDESPGIEETTSDSEENA